jgi:hypothetical protein
VGEQDGDGAQPVLPQQVLDATGGVLTGIDDDALLPLGGRDQVAVGAERPGGEPGDEHDPPSG